MILKDIIEEDYSHYKHPSMVLVFPSCTFKCEKESGKKICQNSPLMNLDNKDISYDYIIQKYTENKLTSAIVCAGLEPMDSFDDLFGFIKQFRESNDDEIVIYTGYYVDEIADEIALLSQYKNIVIKFGRYLPGKEKHYDEVLGIELASTNQYAEKIS